MTDISSVIQVPTAEDVGCTDAVKFKELDALQDATPELWGSPAMSKLQY